MTRILLVDDDAIVRKIYGGGLARAGFQVDTAEDGLAAVKYLQAGKPDLVVLDLMMPKLSGVEVLKFIRSKPSLVDLPLIVLSNAYMTDLAAAAAATHQVQKALLKSSCTPASLVCTIREILAGLETNEPKDQLLATTVRAPAAPAPAPAQPPAAPAASSRGDDAGSAPQGGQGSLGILNLPQKDPGREDEAAKNRFRLSFLGGAAAANASLRRLFRAVSTAHSEAERGVRLDGLCRGIHFLTVAAGQAQCREIAQMAAVLEALLREVIVIPKYFSPSVARTIALAIDFLGELFTHANDPEPDRAATATPAKGLVVDDDAACNRQAVAALHHAQFEAESLTDPLAALDQLVRKRYDLILLDIEMPGIDGFEFYKRARALPDYRATPVIFFTQYDNCQNRVLSVLSGGADLISKPIFPMELATKAVTFLLQARHAARRKQRINQMGPNDEGWLGGD